MIDPVFCAYPCVKTVTDLESSIQVTLKSSDFETFVSRITIAKVKDVLLTATYQGEGYNAVVLQYVPETHPGPHKASLIEALNAIASVEALRKHT